MAAPCPVAESTVSLALTGLVVFIMQSVFERVIQMSYACFGFAGPSAVWT